MLLDQRPGLTGSANTTVRRQDDGPPRRSTNTVLQRIGDARRYPSAIIQQINDRFGTSVTEADRLFFEQIERAAVEVDYVRRIALANNFERFDLGTRDRIRNVIIDRMAENDA